MHKYIDIIVSKKSFGCILFFEPKIKYKFLLPPCLELARFLFSSSFIGTDKSPYQDFLREYKVFRGITLMFLQF